MHLIYNTKDNRSLQENTKVRIVKILMVIKFLCFKFKSETKLLPMMNTYPIGIPSNKQVLSGTITEMKRFVRILFIFCSNIYIYFLIFFKVYIHLISFPFMNIMLL